MQGSSKRPRDSVMVHVMWDRLSSAIKRASEQLPKRISNTKRNQGEDSDTDMFDMKSIVNIARNRKAFDHFCKNTRR